MKTHSQQPERVSRTIQSKNCASKQADIHTILQKYAAKTAQRQADNELDNELPQGKFETAQREAFDEEDPLPKKIREEEIGELKMENENSLSTLNSLLPTNKTGIPDTMKTDFENLAGFSFDGVRIHYNFPEPAQLQALVYTQSSGVHIAPRQEKHLGLELGHVVQQKQEHVQPIMQLRGVNINDNEWFKKEEDEMGYKTNKRHLVISKTDQPIQRNIAQAPIPINHAGILANTGDSMDMGFVQPINGAIAPTYYINLVQQQDGKWGAHIVITQNAFEGNSNGFYRRREIFPTNLMFSGVFLGRFAARRNNLQIYGDLDYANSNLACMAEQEHLNDLRRAFVITLGLAETAYYDARNAGPYIREKSLEAHNAAIAAINNHIAIEARALGTTPFLVGTDLLRLYKTKEQLTQNRDANDWHTFIIDRNNQSQSPLAWAMYLLSLLPGVKAKDFRKIIPGFHFQVPGPASDQVVN